MRLAIVQQDKCHPGKCGNLCARLCPVNRKGEECIKINGKAAISEAMCIGCNICANRCPFKAISIINLPEELKSKLFHRYGENGFALYSIPLPRFSHVLGILGKNGIGKSTSLKILSGKLKPNLGREAYSEKGLHDFLRGSELLNYFKSLPQKKVSIKPQNLFELSKHNLKVKDLLKIKKEILSIISDLALENLLEKSLSELSGGELQKAAIAVAASKESDIYFFDEPLAYLDIGERIRVSNFIRSLIKSNKAVIVIEHDLLMLDYIADFVNIMYGKPSCYGIISKIRASKAAINSYLSGFLKEENIRFRDKPIKFNAGAGTRKKITSKQLFEWPSFTKTYKGFSLTASEGNIPQKSIVGIAGKNATGKSTFIKCLSGIIETDQKDIGLKLKVSYKPQYLESESKELVSAIIKKEKISSRLVSLLSLDQLLFRQINQLSGGELQKVALALCLAKDADVYLIDEPSAHLDVEERLQAAKAIEETVREKEKSAFVVDHDFLFLSYLSDLIMVFSGVPSKQGNQGNSSKPFQLEEGMNALLRQLNITVRRDPETGRPRINKPDSVLDREQKTKNKWFIA